MSQINSLPDFEWSDHSVEEIRRHGDSIVGQSDFAWRIGKVAVAGLIYHSLLSPPWMWFALAKGVGMRDLIDFRRMALLIPRGTLTSIWVDYPLGIRFAEFYGFVATEAMQEHAGRTYRIFRKD